MVRNVDNPSPSPTVQISTPQQISQRTIVLLERQIDDAVAQSAGAIEMNLSATQMIDSAGLNWLVQTQTRLSAVNMQLRLIEVPPIVSDIFLATRLDSRFHVSHAGSTANGEGIHRA